jgi:hypothetical protein
LPKLMVSCVTLISVAKPPVSALARFILSNWKTSSPRNRRSKTEESILYVTHSIVSLGLNPGQGEDFCHTFFELEPRP